MAVRSKPGASRPKPLFSVDHATAVIRSAGLYLDPPSPKPLAFVSHGHALRGGPHTRALATPETVAICEALGGSGRFEAVRFGETCRLGKLSVTLHPAGHMLGSAMLHVESPSGDSLLYTGDFRLSPGLTAERAAPPKARVLVMEAAFGEPKYRFPSREEAAEELISLVNDLFDQNATPVILAYSAGKAQEVLGVLAQDEIPVLVTPAIERVNGVYRLFGRRLGQTALLDGKVPPGHAIVTSPQARQSPLFEKLRKPRFVSLTGWAADTRYASRNRVDHALAFSDHADYGELLDLVKQVGPEEIYLTSGPRSFAAELRALGYGAGMLESAGSRALFTGES